VSATWVAVVVVGAFTISFKAAGPVLLAGRQLPARLTSAFELLAPSLLAALGSHSPSAARAGSCSTPGSSASVQR
jgi:hypothetical protein